MEEREKMPSSAFRSAGRKGMVIPNQDEPGPGAYNPKYEYAGQSPPGGSMRSNIVSKTGREVSVGGADVDRNLQRATSSITGPGSYDSHTAYSIGKDVSSRLKRMSRKAASDMPDGLGFDSRQPGHELPFEKVAAKKSTPAPGTYNPEPPGPKKTFNSKLKSGVNTGFGTFEKREINPRDGRSLTASVTGDPGAYTPNTSLDLAQAAKASFHKANKSGNGAFGSAPGSMSKRSLKLDILGGDGDPTPAPDTYKPESALAGSKTAMAAMEEREKMPSSAFRSAGRKGMVIPNQDEPGPGAYDPNPEVTQNAQPGGSMRSNIVSKTGREVSVGGADVDMLVQRATSTMVGPTSYFPHEATTIKASSEKKARRGWGVHFMSDSVRDMFTALIRNDHTATLNL
jgi:hypothetical protein